MDDLSAVAPDVPESGRANRIYIHGEKEYEAEDGLREGIRSIAKWRQTSGLPRNCKWNLFSVTRTL